LYLGTTTIGNENSHPTNIDSRTRSIRMTSWSKLFFDKSFFSSLENQGREIIPATHKCGKKRSFINLNFLFFGFLIYKVFLADLEINLMIDSYYNNDRIIFSIHHKDSKLIWSPYHTWKLCCCPLHILTRLGNFQNQLPYLCRKRILPKSEVHRSKGS